MDQLKAKDAIKAQSFIKRFEIWLITNVLIHWQDTQADKTRITETDLEQEKLDDFRRDEIRRMCKAAVLYAQREATAAANSDLLETEA